MKLKTLDTLGEGYGAIKDVSKRIDKRFDVVCNLDPTMLLKLCLDMPQGQQTRQFIVERNSVASQYDRMPVFTQVSSAVTELVMPYVEFLMSTYEADQVDDVQAALTMFVSVDLAERSEWSPAYLAAVEKIEEALGF